MTEIPEHLRKRAEAARAKAEAEKAAAGGDAPAAADAPAADETAAAASDAPAAAASGEESRIPAHLLERSRAAKARAEGGEAAGAATGGGVAVAERPAAVTTAAPAPAGGIPVGAGPGGHTQRLLTVVKSGSIQDVKATPVDKVHTWPHLLAGEFVASLVCTAFTFVFSVFVNAPLLQLANPNLTPNPSKAPWYFLGLQELLTMFHPMVAGVTIPGMGLILLILAPYMDRNPSIKPEDRKFTISVFTIFLMFWAVLVIIGSFFRGPGQNFVLPWKSGIFFEL
jgi:quinol---cytochrome c reductase cytochrome c subunit, bacillus type